MKKEIKLIAFQNDALALAASNFFFPIYTWQTASERTKSIVNTIKKVAIAIRTKIVTQIVGLNPNPHYLTLSERLQALPKGFSPKIERATCLFNVEDEIYVLKWHKDTIHTFITTEEGFQKWIVKKIKEIWQELAIYYGKVSDSPLQQFRPSILILESAKSTSQPEIERANDEDFLFSVILPSLFNKNNPLSQIMYEVVCRQQVKRGVWEYRPREEN